jgi:hypothetical protein
MESSNKQSNIILVIHNILQWNYPIRGTIEKKQIEIEDF